MQFYTRNQLKNINNFGNYIQFYTRNQLKNINNFKIVSLFSGVGGLDLGFKNAGFEIIYANEYDKTIWDTFEYNFPKVFLDKRDIRMIHGDNIPDCIGIIGGPPCQSWSEAGSLRGINDPRGKLFFDYIRIIKDKSPLFFVAENVPGILNKRNEESFNYIIDSFIKLGYNVKYKLLNAKDYCVPQERKRIFIIGFSNNIDFQFPNPNNRYKTLQDVIFDLQNEACPFKKKLDEFNNEYYVSGFSSIFMSRNRVRDWHEQSFTIQASARQIPLHPQAPKMELVSADKRIFKKGSEHLYRRLTVRECARIQTFPDEFKFLYKNIVDGYKMVGNAVPVNLSNEIAKKIMEYIIK